MNYRKYLSVVVYSKNGGLTFSFPAENETHSFSNTERLRRPVRRRCLKFPIFHEFQTNNNG